MDLTPFALRIGGVVFLLQKLRVLLHAQFFRTIDIGNPFFFLTCGCHGVQCSVGQKLNEVVTVLFGLVTYRTIRQQR
jgi:hypothetical protein